MGLYSTTTDCLDSEVTRSMQRQSQRIELLYRVHQKNYPL